MRFHFICIELQFEFKATGITPRYITSLRMKLRMTCPQLQSTRTFQPNWLSTSTYPTSLAQSACGSNATLIKCCSETAGRNALASPLRKGRLPQDGFDLLVCLYACVISAKTRPATETLGGKRASYTANGHACAPAKFNAAVKRLHQ